MKNGISLLFLSGLVTVIMACTAINANEPTNDGAVELASGSVENELVENEPANFFLQIGTRFSPIKKSQLEKFSDVQDFLGKEEMERNGMVETTSLIFIENDQFTEMRYDGFGRELTKEQKEILKLASLGSNFCLQTFFETTSEIAKEKGYNEYRPHFTVAPEKQATYVFGFDAVYDYLMETVKVELESTNEDVLAPGMMYFIVSAEGSITDVKMTQSCGIPLIDQKLIKALKDIPGQWIPAENELGDAISQRLVFSYGAIGC